MSVEIVSITRNNLSLAAKAAAKFGMPRSERWLERCLYDPTVGDLVDSDIRGHMAVSDDGEVVAIQCYFYMPGYFRQNRILINTACIMGADSRYGEELICCLDQNKITTRHGQLRVSNCIASPKSAKFAKLYSRMQEGSDEGKRLYMSVVDCAEPICWVLKKAGLAYNWLFYGVWFLLRPLSLMANFFRFAGKKSKVFDIKEYKSIDLEKFGRFWDAFLAGNKGVITSREPKRLAWLFNESMCAGFVKVLSAEKNGEIVGYVLLRRYPCAKGPLSEYAIYDICALNNDVHCLCFLMIEALRYVSTHKGSRLMYIGALPKQKEWVKAVSWHRCIKSKYSPFFYKTNDAGIEAPFKNEDGWFFGALDGEKCLGHGRYVDA